MSETPKITRLDNYKAPDFLIKKVDLVFHLDEERTKVQSRLEITRQNPQATELFLNGEELEFGVALIDGVKVDPAQLLLTKEGLTLKNLPSSFILEITNWINPLKNKALEGLYKSGEILCTQNEAEGFRRITYFPDRPDVMSIYTTKIIGDKTKYPTMLSNGNPIERGELEGNLHYITWFDPYAKPCYLYALVAGDLGLVEDTFTTKSGRKVALQVYCDRGNENKCDHAMVSLKKSMAWDEERFGLEYDLDIYMIVAVDSFNMGAMENKGLNIFNSAYVLARPETATDANFLGIESVIGHEYFHNWTGNRITCRDWFQLTLKEGLTVYRDQEFSSDLNSRPVVRVQNVKRLRAHQFNEDAGPLAHPIKPKTYIEINNFYSSTIYEKGSEVIRMMATLLGREGFRRGMDKYFELFDGQAVTTEDFVHAMSVANDDYDFAQFKLWYDQAGTPEVRAEFSQSLENETVTLVLSQSCPATPGQPEKKPFHMPFLMALIDNEGRERPLRLRETLGQPDIERGLVHLKEAQTTLVFEGITQPVVPSLNREFSAPIKLSTNLTKAQKLALMARDTDAFNRYEMAQELYLDSLERLVEDQQYEVDEELLSAYRTLIVDTSLDPMMKALMLALPTESTLHQRQKTWKIEETFLARQNLQKKLAQTHRQELLNLYHDHHQTDGNYELDPKSIGKRELKNIALTLLSSLAGDGEVSELIVGQYQKASNMTDEIHALTLIHHGKLPQSEASLESFYQKWQKQTLVMQKWIVVQASLADEAVFEGIKRIEGLSIFDKTVPNLVRSLYGAFCSNPTQFHHRDGRGYALMAEALREVDSINPQIAARLADAFKSCGKIDESRRGLMHQHLKGLLDGGKLSKNCYEVISKILA